MQAHVVEIETKHAMTLEATPRSQPGEWQHRWRCSCGRIGDWQGDTSGHRQFGRPRPGHRRARNGGARHVAAMERTR